MEINIEITARALKKRGWKQAKGKSKNYWYSKRTMSVKSGNGKIKFKAPSYRIDVYNKTLPSPCIFDQGYMTSGKDIAKIYAQYNYVRDVDTLEELDKLVEALEFKSK